MWIVHPINWGLNSYLLETGIPTSHSRSHYSIQWHKLGYNHCILRHYWLHEIRLVCLTLLTIWIPISTHLTCHRLFGISKLQITNKNNISNSDTCYNKDHNVRLTQRLCLVVHLACHSRISFSKFLPNWTGLNPIKAKTRKNFRFWWNSQFSGNFFL